MKGKGDSKSQNFLRLSYANPAERNSTVGPVAFRFVFLVLFMSLSFPYPCIPSLFADLVSTFYLLLYMLHV